MVKYKKGTRALMHNHLKQIVTSKHSAEMTVGTLVVIVLAIIVLVVLALGFGAGWTNLWSKITGFFSPVNVDAVKQACQYSCSSQSAYAYCCQVREVRFEKSADPVLNTCNSGKSTLQLDSCDISCSGDICKEAICSGKEKETDKTQLIVCDTTNSKCSGTTVNRKLKTLTTFLTKDEICCNGVCTGK